MTTAVALPPTPVAPTSAPVLPKAAPAALLSDQAQDIPIFLRKTYHMVDTCDPTVACWSEDGETFVVKNPEKFEKQIIPQFFKHSKFSSFVRQLNFYAFRKIKYADTIRIDPKLEAETANYWRFRHEKFQRGKPELLQEIKRMNGQKGTSTSTTKKNATTTLVDKENTALKSEVSQLKSKLEQMTKNIDELTSLVQKVSLQQQQAPAPVASSSTGTVINTNNKRTKVENSMPPLPDIPQSSFVGSASNSMEIDDFSPPSIPSPMHPTLTTSETPSDLSDDTFVDQLFTAFKTEHFDFEDVNSQATPKSTSSQRASPELMAKLSDALATLPLQVQELIVNRLIQAITAPKEIQDALPSNNESIVPQSPPSSSTVTKTQQTPNLPLAAATLAALLAQYGEDAIKAAAKDAAQTNNAKHQATTANNNRKALLIPVHA
eukprot:CAMPEP_0113653164 /NCGR_PEP_ID=MMETSP0017_2-20120614/28421_1 /TAXON_ID=2856 /ORGANISM="Cylindrotheca closterium" /LENGTH=433 /DNA_ID=CAMNT_0000566115 /DNA_START=57 /DNA_END=1358 /DNA_ORIENTATION=- /assembly_acc=CAM_ASM_000147